MDQTFTLDDLAQFNRQEKEILASLGLTEQEMPDVLNDLQYRKEPRNTTVTNILNYSRALSVRDSKIVGSIEMILN